MLNHLHYLSAVYFFLSKLVGERLNHILDNSLGDLHMKEKSIGVGAVGVWQISLASGWIITLQGSALLDNPKGVAMDRK